MTDRKEDIKKRAELMIAHTKLSGEMTRRRIQLGRINREIKEKNDLIARFHELLSGYCEDTGAGL